MNRQPEQRDPIEDALLELRAAEQAGLFAATRVDTEELTRVNPGPASPARRWTVLRWGSVAAVLALVVGLWSVVFKAQIDPVPLPSGPVSVHVAPDDGVDSPDGTFYVCFSGPKSDSVVANRCRTHDFDADGDVDLADFRAFQLAYADPRGGTH